MSHWKTEYLSKIKGLRSDGMPALYFMISVLQYESERNQLNLDNVVKS